MPTPDEIDKDIIGALHSFQTRLDVIAERQRHQMAFIDNLINRVNEVEK